MSRLPLLMTVALLCVCTFLVSNLTKVKAVGTVSGTVYIDHNMNGVRNTLGLAPDLAIDSGVAGITVTIFASDGSSKSTTTDANGEYSIDTASAPSLPPGPYRVEFTGLPTGYNPSAVGTNNGSTVQYVPDGSSANVDLGIISNPDYCQNTPDLYVPLANFGDQDLLTEAALVRFPYTAGTFFTDPDPLATSYSDSNYAQPNQEVVHTGQQIGTVWGITYQRSTGRIFAASYFKRHFGFLNNEPSLIYVSDPASGTIEDTYSVPGITANSHLAGGTTYDEDGDDQGWDAVGKESLGGLDISDDDQHLFVMNLENRNLYRLDASTGSVTGNVSLTGLTLPTPGGTNSACATQNKRPFAVKYHQGTLYLGFVCSGEVDQNVADLRAYVFTADPDTLAVDPTPVVNIALNYPRGMVSHFGGSFPAAWRPWSTVYVDQVGVPGEVSYPQPTLKGITFQNGNMILGVADRFGDQVGYLTYSDPAQVDTMIANAGGDTLMLCGSPGIGWTLESNGRCGLLGSGPQDTGQGPGGGEFFHEDYFNSGGPGHEEVTTGGMDVVPGIPQVVTTVYDPVSQDNIISPVDWAFTQGIRFLSTTTGNTDRSYFVNRADWSKGNDLGQVVAACQPGPLQIGNRIWSDSNRDGVQDPTEAPIANVLVELYVDTDDDGIPDLLVGTAITDSNGNYIFGGPDNNNMFPGNSILPNTAYEVRITASNFGSGGPLEHMEATTSLTDSGPNSSSRDSNGIEEGSYVRALVTTGSYAQNDHTIDFGFMFPPTSSTVTISGLVTDHQNRALGRVTVSVLDPQTGQTRRVTTNPFGYFAFTGLNAGHSYVVSVTSKTHIFDPDTQVVNAFKSVSDVTFHSIDIGSRDKEKRRN